MFHHGLGETFARLAVIPLDNNPAAAWLGCTHHRPTPVGPIDPPLALDMPAGARSIPLNLSCGGTRRQPHPITAMEAHRRDPSAAPAGATGRCCCDHPNAPRRRPASLDTMTKATTHGMTKATTHGMTKATTHGMTKATTHATIFIKSCIAHAKNKISGCSTFHKTVGCPKGPKCPRRCPKRLPVEAELRARRPKGAR
jgi:hypothetical protein